MSLAAPYRAPPPAVHRSASPLGLAIYGGDNRTFLKSEHFIAETPVVETARENSRWSLDTRVSSLKRPISILTWHSASPDLTSLRPDPQQLLSPEAQLQPVRSLRISPSSPRTLSSDAPMLRPSHQQQAAIQPVEQVTANMVKKTRRPSVAQSMLRSFSHGRKSSDRIPTPEVPPPPMPMPQAMEVERMPESPLPATTIRFQPTSAPDAEPQAPPEGTTTGRRPSLFQLLRKSFSQGSIGSRKGSSSSTHSISTRKGSGSSSSDRRKLSISTLGSRKGSTNSTAAPHYPRKLSKERPRQAEQAADAKTAAQAILAAARHQHQSPTDGKSLLTALKKDGKGYQPQVTTAVLPDAPTVLVHEIPRLRQASLSSRSMASSTDNDSMYDYYGSMLEDASHESYETAESKAAHPGGHSPMSPCKSDAASGFGRSPAMPDEDVGGTPIVWNNFGASNGSFINPWATSHGSSDRLSSSVMVSPGGRRSSTASFASSRQSSAPYLRPVSANSHDMAPNELGPGSTASVSGGSRRHGSISSTSKRGSISNGSLAAARRASLAAVVQAEQARLKEEQAKVQAAKGLGSNEANTSSTSLQTGSVRDKKNRYAGIIDGDLLRPSSVHSNSPAVSLRDRPRKSSLVLPGDPRLLHRRKSSLSVTFAEHSDDGAPIKPPMPLPSYFSRMTASNNNTHGSYTADTSSSDASSINSLISDDTGSLTSQTSSPSEPPPFFELRNPWTGYSMKQPQAVFDSPISPQADPVRRSTLMPTTPGSIASPGAYSPYDHHRSSRSSISGQRVSKAGAGMRVSLDFHSYS